MPIRKNRINSHNRFYFQIFFSIRATGITSHKLRRCDHQDKLSKVFAEEFRHTFSIIFIC